jgi:two-component system, chemotaxis family, protein-glutamate methylesterase/glutaminase
MGSVSRTLRVLAADDSTVMRGVMRTVFQLHAGSEDTTLPRMELCGIARNGVEALEAVRALAPDVLLLDLEMPGLNGLGVLEKLRVVAPGLPVIMCSAHTERGARSTLEALAAGAKDYVMKPGQQRDFAAALDLLMEELLPKIAALAGAGMAPMRSVSREIPLPPRYAPPHYAGGRIELVVIGVSTGGPSALEAMLPMLPVDFPAPIMIVQHMPKLFTGALADRLDHLCALNVRQARDGDIVRPGSILLAPGDCHMEVAASRGEYVVSLHQGPMLNSCKPSVDYLFRSAAETYGAAALALIMTGMGADGFDGAQAVRSAGGIVIAQDQASSAVWGMPGRVARAGLAEATLPLGLLAQELIRRTHGGRQVRNSEVAAASSRQEVIHGML